MHHGHVADEKPCVSDQSSRVSWDHLRKSHNWANADIQLSIHSKKTTVMGECNNHDSVFRSSISHGLQTQEYDREIICDDSSAHKILLSLSKSFDFVEEAKCRVGCNKEETNQLSKHQPHKIFEVSHLTFNT